MNTRRGSIGRMVSLVSLTILPSCAVIHRPPATIETLLADGNTARVTKRATLDTLVARLERRARDRDTLDILLLSGGGQSGAYGAGFMRGWRTRTGANMPQFDLVTGISTGALQAPFALIGTERALDTLSGLYRNAAERIAPRINLLFWLRKTGGIVKPDRLRHTIERMLNDSLAGELRHEFAGDRQMFIGTSDMDLGTQHAWDASRLLDTTAAGLHRLQTVLLSSSAIPGIFPPAVLERHVHSDGGVLGNFVPLLDLEQYRALGARRSAEGLTRPVTVRVFLVINIWLDAPPLVVDPSSRSAISERSLVTMFFALQQQLVERLRLLTSVVTAEVPGVRMELRVTHVPSELSTARGAQSLFDGPFIRRLEQLGYERAQGATPWDVVELPPARRVAPD